MSPCARAVIVSVVALLAMGCAGPLAPPSGPSPPAPPAATLAVTPNPSRSASVVDRATLRGTIVYSSDASGNDDVYILRLDGDGEPIRLTNGPEKEFDPALSPDGTQIAYRRNPTPGRDEADIWIMQVDGGDKRNLTNAPEASNWSPAWLPDGRIVWSTTRGNDDGTLELWTMARDGSDARQVAAGWCEYPSPSPDGSHIACAAAVAGRYDIVVVDVADGDRRSLTATPESEFGPSWSPDGQWIAFSRDATEAWRLLRVRADGTDEQPVADEGVFSAWDPSGHLAWSGPGGINVANADGSGRIVLDYPAGFISWGDQAVAQPRRDGRHPLEPTSVEERQDEVVDRLGVDPP